MRRVDIGLGLAMVPPMVANINYDIRFQILKSPVAMAILVGANNGMTGGPGAMSWWSGPTSVITISKNRWYWHGGVQLVSRTVNSENIVTLDEKNELMLLTYVGREFGRKWILAPEIGLVNFHNQTVPAVGLGFKFKSG